jgi:Tat protein translocase TatB subunit
MYLFILESIGTSELVIIGLVALIFLGPRKLPELARSIAKAMNEFRRSTSEFKQTWDREVVTEVNTIKSEIQVSKFLEDSSVQTKNSIEKNTITNKNIITAPEIKEVSEADFQGLISRENSAIEKRTPETVSADKQSWL